MCVFPWVFISLLLVYDKQKKEVKIPNYLVRCFGWMCYFPVDYNEMPPPRGTSRRLLINFKAIKEMLKTFPVLESNANSASLCMWTFPQKSESCSHYRHPELLISKMYKKRNKYGKTVWRIFKALWHVQFRDEICDSVNW